MAILYLSRRFGALPAAVADASPDDDARSSVPVRRSTDGIADAEHDDAQSARRENRLGDWSATRLALRPARFVLAVSEHARLAVVVDALPDDTLLQRIPDALYALLLGIRVPADLARRERRLMQPLRPAAASPADNGAAGVLKIYATELQVAWDTAGPRSAAELSLRMAGLATELLAGATPAQATRRRFHLLPDQTGALGL